MGPDTLDEVLRRIEEVGGTYVRRNNHYEVFGPWSLMPSNKESAVVKVNKSSPYHQSPDFDKALFAAGLKAERRKRKLSQVRLANFIGVSGPTLCQWENQQYAPQPAILATIMKRCNWDNPYGPAGAAPEVAPEPKVELADTGFQMPPPVLSEPIDDLLPTPVPESNLSPYDELQLAHVQLGREYKQLYDLDMEAAEVIISLIESRNGRETKAAKKLAEDFLMRWAETTPK